jgi:hypothetical protein
VINMTTPPHSHGIIEEEILVASEPVTGHVKSGTTLTISGTVAGSAAVINAKGLETVGATIQPTEAGTMVEWSGKYKFTGVSVSQPAGCKTSGTIETASLTGRLKMKEGSATEAFMEFKPTSGETVATIALEGCAAEGKYPLKGEFAGKFANNTGVSAVAQQFNFGTKEANEVSALKLGTSAATFAGEVQNELKSGKSWSVTE